MRWFSDADLTQLNSLSLPCIARSLVRIASADEIPAVLVELNNRFPTVQPLILGGGSNVVLPAVLSRPVIQLELNTVEWLQDGTGEGLTLVAGASVHWDQLVKETVELGWRGLENLSLIPGTMGAAPIQNIGAYGVELCDVFEFLEAYDTQAKLMVRLAKNECRFAYRDSIFKRQPGRFIITAVALKLSKSKSFSVSYGELNAFAENLEQDITVQQIRDKVVAVRRAKLPDPIELPNAGSFFKNPIISAEQFSLLENRWPDAVAFEQDNGDFKMAAGWMIDQLGWKGKRMGPVGMHDKQALVLVNYGGAVQADVLALAEEVAASVEQNFGVSLEIEPQVVRG